MRCSGPSATITLAAPHLETNFTGVSFTSSCADSPDRIASCLITICSGRVVFRNSSVAGVQGIPLQTLVCVVGGSRLEVHNSRFLKNQARALAVFDQAQLVLHASNVSHNVVQGDGGGILVKGRAIVTITDGSRVQNNTASLDGGGLYIGGTGTVRLTGGSSAEGNTANKDGGGMPAWDNATVTLTGGSSVHGNTAEGCGGGLYVTQAKVAISGGSHVHGNTAKVHGGGLDVRDAIVALSGGSSVHGNTALGNGGGMVVWNTGTVTVSGASVNHNRAGTVNRTGGGLCIFDKARVTISHSSVTNNTCTDGFGGGISVGFASVFKFGIRGLVFDVAGPSYIPYDPHVTISNSTITNNTSIRSAGGGVAVANNATLVLDHHSVIAFNRAVDSSGGGAVLVQNALLRAADGVVFANNSVGKGFVGSTIAAFGNSTLQLPLRGQTTRCSGGVYLGLSTCNAGEIVQHDLCVCCPQHTFSFTGGTDAKCQPCPANAKCSAGSIVEPVLGYYQSAPTSIQMHRCPLSTTACNYTGPGHMCNVGYSGPLCGVCRLPEYGMLTPLSCAKCMPRNVQLGVYLLLSCVSVLFVAYTVHATWLDNLEGTKGLLGTDLIKVLVQFVQYVVIIGSVAITIQRPLFSLEKWFQAAGVVFAVGSSQTLSLDCWLYNPLGPQKLPLAIQRHLVYFLAPVFVLLAVVALQWLAWAVRRWVVPLVWWPKKGDNPQPAVVVLSKLPVTLLVLTYYAYPSLLRASLSFFACLRIDRDNVQLPPGATAPLSHRHGYWVSDIEQACFAGYHTGWAYLLFCCGVLSSLYRWAWGCS